MASCAIDTAIRNAIAVGGKLSHLAILDNFCWCSSYDKTRLAELVDAAAACYDFSVGFGTPLISGKDSMFNDFKGYDLPTGQAGEKPREVKISIPPTLVISSIGVMDDINKSVTPEFKMPGDAIYLLGETHDEMGGGEYFKMLGELGNNVPKVDLEKNIKIYEALEKAIQKEFLASSISLTSGGLAIALARASIGGMLGANISLNNLLGTFTNIDSALFSESQGRILVTVAKKNIPAFEKLVKSIPFSKLGTVSKEKTFTIKSGAQKIVNTKVETLAKSYHAFSNKNK